MGATVRAPADIVAQSRRARSRRHHLARSAKRTTRAPSLAPSSGRATNSHRARRWRSPRSSPASCMRAPGAIHPATRTFQALRIFVNDELGELARGLAAAERALKPSGRSRRRSPSIRSKTASSKLSSPSVAARRPARATGRTWWRRRRPSACSRAGRKRPTTPRSPPIRAPARPSCAPPSARDAPPRATPIGTSAAAAAFARRRHAGAAVILRVLNFVVIGALVLAAAHVYRIKFDATVQAEQLAKLRGAVRHERDGIAALRAEWGELDNPARIQALANAILQLKPIAPTQFDTLDRPARPAGAATCSRQQRSDRRHDRKSRAAPAARDAEACRHAAAVPPSRQSRQAERRGMSATADTSHCRRTSIGARTRRNAVAAAADPQAALRPQHRSRRQGEGADRPRDPRFRRDLFRHRRAARHVRRRSPTATSPTASSPATPSPPRARTSSTATARSWRPTCVYPRCTPSRAGSSTSTRRSNCSPRILPDLDATELRERLSSKRGFVWLKRDITPEQQREIYRQGLPGIGFLNENKRDYPNGAEVSHLIGHVDIDNQGIAGIEKWLDGQGLAALAHGGPCHRPAAKCRCSSPSICACSTRCATSSSPRARNSARSPPPASCSTCAPARSSRWCRSRTTTRTIRTKRSIRPASTA